MRDSVSAPRGRGHRPASAARTRRPREVIPAALGGHDITCAWQHLSRPWQCRVCHRTAAKRAALCYTRCPGSAALRWARLAATAAASGEGAGGGHYMLLTDTVAWCWRCWASACARVRCLARPCLGRPRGFLVQARQRLLLGLHPSTRVPLGAITVPEPGRSMPGGFGNAVRRAEASATAAASSRRVPGPGMAASCAPPQSMKTSSLARCWLQAFQQSCR